MTGSSGKTVWVKISADCLSERAIHISDLLEEAGALSVSILPLSDDRTRVDALFEPDSSRLPTVRSEIEFFKQKDSDFRLTEISLADRDWVGESQRSLQPVEISKTLRIVAPWHEAGEHDRSTVIINPGTSFGTGHHETTNLCVKFLSRLNLNECTVVDYGCGSGVLAIAALVLGAKAAWGIDIDPDALHESRENAIRNGVEIRYRSCLPSEIPSELQADVVIANLFADALEDLCFDLVQLTRPGGYLVLSGIVHSQVDRICSRYSKLIKFSTESMGEWSLLTGQRLVSTNPPRSHPQ